MKKNRKKKKKSLQMNKSNKEMKPYVLDTSYPCSIYSEVE